MSNEKVVVIGKPGTFVIGAQALLNRIVHERENPGLLIIPNLKEMDEKTIKEIINEVNLYPHPIIASLDDEII